MTSMHAGNFLFQSCLQNKKVKLNRNLYEVSLLNLKKLNDEER